MTQRPSLPFADTLDRFEKYAPKGRDLTLILLKSHLIVEEEMNELIELLLPHPEFLYRSRFGFLQRLRVLQAVSSDTRFHALANAIELLNEMRNALAHQLEPVKVKELAPAFIEAAFNAAAQNPKRDADQRTRLIHPQAKFSLSTLKSAIAIVVGLLGHMKDQQYERHVA